MQGPEGNVVEPIKCIPIYTYIYKLAGWRDELHVRLSVCLYIRKLVPYFFRFRSRFLLRNLRGWNSRYRTHIPYSCYTIWTIKLKFLCGNFLEVLSFCEGYSSVQPKLTKCYLNSLVKRSLASPCVLIN